MFNSLHSRIVLLRLSAIRALCKSVVGVLVLSVLPSMLTSLLPFFSDTEPRPHR